MQFNFAKVYLLCWMEMEHFIFPKVIWNIKADAFNSLSIHLYKINL